MESISEVIQQSVVNVKSKIVPQRVANAPAGVEGDLLLRKELYDFMGLDFKSRTGREALEINKKIDAIIDYIKENYDDVSSGLGELERVAGAKDVNSTLLDHFYRTVKYKTEAFESLPKEEKVRKSENRIGQVQKEIEALHKEIRESSEKLKEAKQLQKMASRLERLEEMKRVNEKKLDKMREVGEKRLEAIKKQQEALKNELNVSTPITDL